MIYKKKRKGIWFISVLQRYELYFNLQTFSRKIFKKMKFLKIKNFKIKICKNLKIGEVFKLHPKK